MIYRENQNSELEFCLKVYGPTDIFLRELKNSLVDKFLEEIFKSKARKNSDKWSDHGKYGCKDSMYYIETTENGFSYFYYKNLSKSLSLKEEIMFKK